MDRHDHDDTEDRRAKRDAREREAYILQHAPRYHADLLCWDAAACARDPRRAPLVPEDAVLAAFGRAASLYDRRSLIPPPGPDGSMGERFERVCQELDTAHAEVRALVVERDDARDSLRRVQELRAKEVGELQGALAEAAQTVEGYRQRSAKVSKVLDQLAETGQRMLLGTARAHFLELIAEARTALAVRGPAEVSDGR